MTTRTLRRPEWVALLAATLVATLIATMFAFTSAAHATEESHSDETPVVISEADDANDSPRSVDEAGEQVDEELLLRGPDPILLPESTPDPEAHNNGAPGIETNPAGPEQHNETEPLDEADQVEEVKQLEETTQPEKVTQLEGTETSDPSEQPTAQSNHGDEASNPNIDRSAATPMSGQESVTLSLSPGPGQQPGIILQAGGNCGTVPSTGYRTLSLTGALPAQTVWAELGSWDGRFVGNVPTAGVAPDSDGRYTVTLTCNYGATPTPTQTATATYQTYPASISGTIRWTDGTGIQGVTVRVFDETTDEHVGDLFPTTASGSYGPIWFPPGSYRLQYLSADGEELAVRNQVLFVDSTAVIDIDVPLHDWTASVRGTLTWQTGEPYVNADIALTGTDYLGDPVHLQVQSNSDGEFLFPEVQKGEYTVWGEPVIVTDPIEYVVNIVHDAPHPGKITGTATFSDGSFATGYVVLTYPNGYTRSATLSYGAFVFDDVSPGTYQLSLSSDYPAPNGPEPFSSGDIEVEVSSNQTTVQDIELVMPTATIQGLVGSSVDGSPLPGFSVSIWTQGLSDTTDAGGNFTLEPIEGAGSLLIEVHNPDGLPLTSFPVIMPQVGGYDFIPIYIDPTILPGEIKGTVTATDGSPIVSATIRVRITEITGVVDVATTTTEADGSYSITDLEPNWYLVDLIIGGKQVANRHLHVSNGQSVVLNFTDVDLTTAPDTGDVDGTVTWDDGTPVDGEAVLLVPVSGGTTLDTATNTDGTYEFSDVEVGDYLVQVIIDGDIAAEQTATAEADETTTVDFVVPTPVTAPSPGAIDGEILWADGSGPVEGVDVEITDGTTTLSDTTDSDGAFGFEDLAPGLWQMTASYAGTVVFDGIINVPEGRTVGFLLTLPASAVTPDTGTIDGAVTWDDGTPVAGETVRLIPSGGGANLETTTNTDGTYEFSDVEVGDYLVQVIIDGDVAAEQTATVDADQTTTADLVIPVLVVTPDSGAIDGEARWADLSGPVDGVEVEITDGAVVLNDTTGPLGQFGFDDLAPGMWHLTATYDGDVVASHIVTVAEGDVSSVTIDVPVPAVTPETGAVEGTVTWDDDTPVEDGSVLLVPIDGGTTLDTTTNADGTYEFTDVEIGDYLVQVIIDGDVSAEQTATVEADETTTVDLVAPLSGGTPDPGSLHGDARWSDLSGPVDGVEIEIIRGATTLRDTTGPSGAYAFDGIEAGFWNLTATYDGDVILTGPINVPEGDVVWLTIDVPLPVIGPETGTVDGTVTWEGGTPVDGETVRLVAVGGGSSLDTTTNADGTYEFTDVEVGDYLVQVIFDGDVSAEQTATVEADQTTTVNLVVATANDSDTGSTPDDETEEPTLSDPDMSDRDALAQTGLSSDTSALLLVAPLLLMLGLLTMWTARRNGVRQDLPK